MINVGSATSSRTRTLVMGVVNILLTRSPDGHVGRWVAIRHARDLVVEGADHRPSGGESTRPGTERTPSTRILRRVLPVVKALVAVWWQISPSTHYAPLGGPKAVVEAGATIVNDVSRGQAGRRKCRPVCCRGAGVDYVLMHWRSIPPLQNLVDYDDVVAGVISETFPAGRRSYYRWNRP